MYSHYSHKTEMKKKGNDFYLCPVSGLVYPILHNVPVTVLDDKMRIHCYQTDKFMENDGVFGKKIPLESFLYPPEKRTISFIKGFFKLIKSEYNFRKNIPLQLIVHILRALVLRIWRRPLELVQRGYELWDFKSLYYHPNDFFLGIESGPKFFEWNANYVRHKIKELVSNYVSQNKCKNILEVGCGYGYQLLLLSEDENIKKTCKKIYGTDITYSRVALANLMHEQHNKSIPFQFFQADARFLPYPDNFFDVGTTTYVFEVMTERDSQHALLELLRVCKKIILIEPLKDVQNIYSKLTDIFADHGGMKIDFLDKEKYEINVEKFYANYLVEGAILSIAKK